MSVVERSVVLLNSALAAVAFFVNVYAARDAGHPWKVIRASIATLAAIYALGYLWLFFNPGGILGWSATFRGISPLSWPVVWIIPALVMRRTQKRVQQIVRTEDPQ